MCRPESGLAVFSHAYVLAKPLEGYDLTIRELRRDEGEFGTPFADCPV